MNNFLRVQQNGKLWGVSLVMLAALSACGGGGDGAASLIATPVAPTPVATTTCYDGSVANTVGADDGTTESFAFTEAEGHLSGGVQLAGQHWGRSLDRLGVAVLRHTINEAHRNYLAAGGAGFLLGDGRLRYGPETFLEGYYRFQVSPAVQISPDIQYARNPGSNRDRGPAVVTSLRANLRY